MPTRMSVLGKWAWAVVVLLEVRASNKDDDNAARRARLRSPCTHCSPRVSIQTQLNVDLRSDRSTAPSSWGLIDIDFRSTCDQHQAAARSWLPIPSLGRCLLSATSVPSSVTGGARPGFRCRAPALKYARGPTQAHGFGAPKCMHQTCPHPIRASVWPWVWRCGRNLSNHQSHAVGYALSRREREVYLVVHSRLRYTAQTIDDAIPHHTDRQAQ